MEFLTVIVPAWNVEKWVEPCMESLMHQTDRDFRILLVDDGSTDGTGAILDRYAGREPERITCIHQENRGLGAARNRGLSQVRTPYVTFLDSDDWLDLRFVELVRKAVTRDQPDILFTLPWISDCVTHRVEIWRDKPLLETLFFPEGRPRILSPQEDRRIYGLEPSVNRRVFRSAFLFEINFSFPEGRRWEDVEPHFAVLHRAKRCAGLRDTGFFYRVGRENQITGDRGPGRLDMVPVFRSVLGRAREEGWDGEELVWILDLLWRFSRWSIGMADTGTQDTLLRLLHGLFREIPGSLLRSWYRELSVPRGDRLAVLVLRSPCYGILGDYRLRRSAEIRLQRLRRGRS